jgi:hypothetical protein
MVDSMVQFAKENWNILFIYFYAFGFVLEPEGIKKNSIAPFVQGIYSTCLQLRCWSSKNCYRIKAFAKSWR